jgi:SAM-dependent methyltransferase
VDPRAYEVVHELEESHWFFAARRNILRRLLDDFVAGADRPRILDVGCGTGVTMGFLEGWGDVTGIDASPKAVEFCREEGRERLCLADGESLPFLDGCFDLVTALDLLEHLEHEEKGLAEARRVLRPGGGILLVVPAFGFLWSDFDRFSGHYRRYSGQELKQVIEKSGFEINRLSYFNTLLFPLVWGVRAVKNWAGRWATLPSDLEMPDRRLNGLLTRVFSLESGLIAARDLPFGVSLVCTARKKPG